MTGEVLKGAHRDEKGLFVRDEVPDPPFGEVEQQQLLAYIRDNPDCSVREAAAAVGVQRRQVRALRRDDPDFDADYHEARGLTPEKILAEIRRRAIDGVDEPVFYEGEICGHVRRYSDRLLGQLGKAFVPQLREQMHVTGGIDARMEVTVEHDFSALLAKLESVGLIQGSADGVAAAVDAAPLALQPARPD